MLYTSSSNTVLEGKRGLSDLAGMDKPRKISPARLALSVRIKEARGTMTQAEIARRLDMTRAAVSQWENGHTEPTSENLRELAQILNVKYEWLAGGQGDKYADGYELTREPLEEVACGDDASGGGLSVSSQQIYKGKLPGASPEIDITAGAGPGGLPLPAILPSGNGVVYAAEAVRGEIVLPPALLSEYTRASAGRIHWIRVRGDSMESTLDPGDRVAVDTTDMAIGGGGVFVLRDWDGEIIVKRLRKIPGSQPTQIEVVSDNPKQGSFVVDAESITIIGRVVARLSRIG